MNTEKVNQHYIPKFYLRLFSYQSNQKQIGLFNLYNHHFINNAKLKTQASKKFFYGADGLIEDSLMLIESLVAPIVINISRNCILPFPNSSEHITLLYFIALTVQRNPISIKYPLETRRQMKSLLEKEFGTSEEVTNLIPQPTRDEAIKMSLSNIQLIVDLIRKMSFKLLVNATDYPFITGDFPVVRYNQYLESKKWIGGDAGFGNTGLQIITPINSKLILIIYDQRIYKVGDSQSRVVTITDDQSVHSLNMLQFLNCEEQVFFDHLCDKAYLTKILTQSNNYNKANKIKASLANLIKSNGKVEKNAILHVGASNLRVKLKIQNVKFTKQGRKEQLDKSMAQTRKNIKDLLHAKQSLIR